MFYLKEKKNRGFTLTEAIIVVAIFSAVMLVVGLFQRNFFDLNRLIYGTLENQNALKKILNPLSGEVRAARISESGDYFIEESSENTFIFYSDIDLDGDADKVKYFLEDNTFKKSIIPPSGNPPTYDENDEIVVNIVRDIIDTGTPIFRYYDSNFVSIASTTALVQPVSPTDVSLIVVEVSSDKDPNKPPAPASVRTLVTLRNR